MFNSLPKRTGIYHIKDNINCLELEVRFRHVNSLLKLPRCDFNRNAASTKSLQSRAPKSAGHASDERDEQVSSTRIKWQQKLLSPSEVELYKEPRHCTTDTQKRYHEWLQAEGLTARSDESVVSGSRSSKKKRRAKKLRQAAAPDDSAVLYGGDIYTYVHEDHFQPDAAQTLSTTTDGNRAAANTQEPPELMYVYAVTTPDTQLAVLRWHPRQRQLHIYPDFNDFALDPYYIEIDTDYRHLYAYAVHNVSLRRHRQTPLNFLQLPAWPTHWSAEQELAAQFAMPPKRTRRVALLFEIRSARGFPYNNLHVRYHVRLPPSTLLEEGLLHASTHASTATSGAHGTRHFGYNWQLTLLCEEDFQPDQLLHVYFELISIDGWERERAEGYAHYSTHLLPGCDTAQLQCLRPADGLLDALSRYLIGGRRKFDFVRYFTEPAESALQNRSGCMQSTGQLHISCQRLVQRNCELLQPCGSRTSGMTLDDIMLAYREARKRLEAVTLK